MVALRASVVVSESNEILPKMRVSVKKESVDCDILKSMLLQVCLYC